MSLTRQKYMQQKSVIHFWILCALGASPLDPSRGLSRCALWSSFTFSRLDHCQFQCLVRAADWALQADTREHALQPAAACRPPQQRDSWHRQRHPQIPELSSDLNSSIGMIPQRENHFILFRTDTAVSCSETLLVTRTHVYILWQ